MKKILIVMMHLEMGGAEKSLISFLNELSPGCAEIDLLLIKQKGVLLKQVPEWVNVVDAPTELRSLFNSKFDSFTGVCCSIIRLIGTGITKLLVRKGSPIYYRWRWFYSRAVPMLEKQYDVAIAYLTGESMYYVAEKVTAEKKLVWVHTDLQSSGAYQKEHQHYFMYFDHIITVSDQCAQSIMALFQSIKERVVYLPNIVSQRVIRMKAQEQQLEHKPNVFKIVSVGRLEKVKGFDMAVSAAAKLKALGVQFVWNIIGEGSEHENLQKLISENELENEVILLGQKENPYPYIFSSDLMVQTSRFEGKSIALDEAKILGVPILATNYRTVKDQLLPDEGWIVDMTPDAISNGIANIINDTEEYRKVKTYLHSNDYGNVELINNYMQYLGIENDFEIKNS